MTTIPTCLGDSFTGTEETFSEDVFEKLAAGQEVDIVPGTVITLKIKSRDTQSTGLFPFNIAIHNTTLTYTYQVE